MTSHCFTIVAIATITAFATLSTTHHLLSRPWCIHLRPDGDQAILYGNRCDRLVKEPGHTPASLYGSETRLRQPLGAASARSAVQLP